MRPPGVWVPVPDAKPVMIYKQRCPWCRRVSPKRLNGELWHLMEQADSDFPQIAGPVCPRCSGIKVKL